jgi:FlaG/FlaF family flagellin (archaellin)
MARSFSLPTSTLGAGSHSITAAYSGTSSGSPQFGTSNISTLHRTVNQASHLITFDQGTPTTKTFGDADFTVSATGGGSGNPLTFAA